MRNILFIASVLLLGTGLSGCEQGTETEPILSIEEYLERHNITDYIKTPSGLIYTVNKVGTGEFPIPGNIIYAHYTGYRLDDTKFDSSYDIGEPYSFKLNDTDPRTAVIDGWNEGFVHFKKGGSGTLFIPWELAYGESGFSTIGAREDLKFDINVVAIQ